MSAHSSGGRFDEHHDHIRTAWDDPAHQFHRRTLPKYGVRELSLFGSILRDDFRPESDIDFLVVFGDDDLGPWMAKLLNMEEELSVALGHVRGTRTQGERRDE